MDQLFGELSGAMGRGSGLSSAAPVALAPSIEWMPAIDVFERDGQLVVQADLPGVGVDDVAIEVEDNVLTVSGERREEREIGEDGLRRIERRYGRFSRTIALPEGAQPDQINAAFRDGVLEITVPVKPAESQQRRRIGIQTRSDSSSTASSQGGGRGDSAAATKANADTREKSPSGA
jgi:HSP20 family protein